MIQDNIKQFKDMDSEVSIPSSKKVYPKVAIDGVFFQMANTGIARVWSSLLTEWSKTEFSSHIVVFDRGNTAPKISGINYCSLPEYNYETTGKDSKTLEKVCQQEEVDLFISTYYTTPTKTPSVILIHDMIPEVIGADLNQPMWREKNYGVFHACGYICVSQNTARDLVRFFPEVANKPLIVARNGIDKTMTPPSEEKVNQFKIKYNLDKPYFLIVGSRFGLNGYKNTLHFFRAFKRFPERDKFAVVCTGENEQLEPEITQLIADANISVHTLYLDNQELQAAYSGATALVYPSLYEGFGLPILEAMACGCPVITCENSSIPEVAGQAALYVSELDVQELVEAFYQVQETEVRSKLITAGLEQVKRFSWSKMAEEIANFCHDIAEQISEKEIILSSSFWQEIRALQDNYQTQKQQLSSSQQQLSSNQRKLSQTQQQLSSNQQQLQATQKELSETRLSLTNQLNEQVKQVEKLQQQLKSADIDRSRLIENFNLQKLKLHQTIGQRDQKIEKLKKLNTHLKQEISFLSTTKAAIRKLAKTTLQKLGVYETIYNNDQFFVKTYNFILRDSWQPSTKKVDKKSNNSPQQPQRSASNKLQQNTEQTSSPIPSKINPDKIDLNSTLVNSLVIAQSLAVNPTYEQLKSISETFLKINHLLCINPSRIMLPTLGILAQENIKITCIVSPNHPEDPSQYGIEVTNQELGDWMITTQTTSLKNYDTLFLDIQTSAETIMLLQGRLSKHTKIIVIGEEN